MTKFNFCGILSTKEILRGFMAMPSSVDLDNLEQNINGLFLEFLAKGGIDVNDYQAISKIKHNTFEAALIYIYNNLLKPDKNLINNQRSLLPYNDNNILNNIADIYIHLCTMCDKSTGIEGFNKLTGIGSETLRIWSMDELNPERMGIINKIRQNNKHIITNRLQDTPLGSVAVANNSEEVGLMWSKNNQAITTQNNTYILPGESVKNKLLAEMPEELPQSVDITQENTA